VKRQKVNRGPKGEKIGSNRTFKKEEVSTKTLREPPGKKERRNRFRNATPGLRLLEKKRKGSVKIGDR